MSEERYDEMRRRLSVAAPPPPADLLDKLKSEIPPDLAKRAEEGKRGASMADHPSVWRLAASIIMIFGFTYVASRTFLASRDQNFMMQERAASPAVAQSASRDGLPEQAIDVSSEPAALLDEVTASAPSPQSRSAEARELSSGFAVEKEQALPSPPRRTKAAKPAPVLTAEESKKEDQPGRFEGEVDDGRANARDARADERPTMIASAPPPPPSAPSARQSTSPTSNAASEAVMRKSVALGAKTSAVIAPELISRTPIELNDADKRHSGTVTVDITVSAEGKVTKARVVDGISRSVDRLVVASVKQWRYRPGSVDGDAVEQAIRIVVCVQAKHRLCV